MFSNILCEISYNLRGFHIDILANGTLIINTHLFELAHN